MTRMLSTLAALILFAGSAAYAQDQNQDFRVEDVERAKTFWVDNATGGNPIDCLLTLNKALKLLYDDPDMQLSSTVDKSMARLKALGRAQDPIVFGFYDEEGRKTFGVTEPKTLRESVWDTMVARSEGVIGYAMYGFSPLDGNHSVVLTLDNTDPRDPKVYWSDQWSTKGGWKLYATKEALDGEIERLTSSWWRSKLASLKIKFRSDAKLYPLIPTNPAPQPERPEIATLRVPRWNLRTRPTTQGNRPVELAQQNRHETFKVLTKQGAWYQLERADGTQVWAHERGLLVRPDPNWSPVAVEAADEAPVEDNEGAADALRVVRQ